MAGCGGECTCVSRRPGAADQVISEPRDRVTITDAIARVVVDNRVVIRALELHKFGYGSEDIIVQINLEKEQGIL